MNNDDKNNLTTENNEDLQKFFDALIKAIDTAVSRWHKRYIRRDIVHIINILLLQICILQSTRPLILKDLGLPTNLGWYNVITLFFYIFVTAILWLVITWLVFDIHGRYSHMKYNFCGFSLCVRVHSRICTSRLICISSAYIMGFVAIYESLHHAM